MKTNPLRLFIFFFFISRICIYSGPVKASDAEGALSLEQTIQNAIDANIQLKISVEEIAAADALKKSSRAAFLPSFNVAYQYERFDEELRSTLFGVTRFLDNYTFSASVSQPLFMGFAILNQYKIAGLGLDAAELAQRMVRREIVLEAKKAYFTILKTQKLLKVSKDTLTQITAHKDVAKSFYEVGMTPLNDYLQAQVELANAEQGLVVAQNNLELALAGFNTLLRRSLSEPVVIQDILTYTPVQYGWDECFIEALENRTEVKIADVDIDIAAKKVKLTQKDFLPTLNLTGTYYEIGNDWNLTGTTGVSDPDGWSLAATAQWTLWEGGKSYYGRKEKRHRLSQAKQKKQDLLDRIRLEVKQAYLKTRESEKNILAVQKAIEQAKENFRINQERYKEQVATSTDVLDAQTLLSRIMTNYYNALYDFKIAKATLYRAMGWEVME